jgi:fluoroquinolone transport system permease protein
MKLHQTQKIPASAQEERRRSSCRRLGRLALGELCFAWKYGIIPLYALLAVIYLLLLSAIAPGARFSAGGGIIFTDPAAMGLFFMGAMVLLEKSQRVNCALAVSPVRVWEYITAKAFALMAVGLAVALTIVAAAGMNLAGTALSVMLGSVLFTLLGMIVACGSDSLNRFLILTIPIELVAFTPALFYWFGSVHSPLWLLHPGVATVALLAEPTALWLPAVASLLAWDALAFWLCHRTVERYFIRLGGGRL